MIYFRQLIWLIVHSLIFSKIGFSQVVDLPFQVSHVFTPSASQFDFEPLAFHELIFDSGKPWHQFGVLGSAMVSSNSVTYPFSLALLRNEFVDQDLKDESSEKLNEKNAFEFNYRAGVFYQFYSDSFLFRRPAFYLFEVRTAGLQQIRFTDDVFNTIFYGNAYYAGEEADYSKSRYQTWVNSQFRFGAQTFFGKEKKLKIGTALSFLAARTGRSADIHSATLFTEENGEYIDADYGFDAFISDSSNHGRTQIDAWGTSLDFFISTKHFVIKVNDLGFLSWNSRSRSYTADSSILFEGLETENLFSPDNSSLINYNVDTLLSETGTHTNLESKMMILPMRFSFAWHFHVMSGIPVYAGISYRPFPDLLPYFFVRPQYTFWKSKNHPSFARMACLISYGGTANFQFGASAIINVENRWTFSAGSENLLAFAVPHSSTSTSLFLRTSVLF